LVWPRQLVRGSCGLRQVLAVGWTSDDAQSFQEGASLRWLSAARPHHAGLIGWWSAAPVCFTLSGEDLLPLLWPKWFVPGAGAVAVVGFASRFPGEGSKDLIAFQEWYFFHLFGPFCNCITGSINGSSSFRVLLHPALLKKTMEADDTKMAVRLVRIQLQKGPKRWKKIPKSPQKHPKKYHKGQNGLPMMKDSALVSSTKMAVRPVRLSTAWSEFK
jgi:hypothetical protein